MKEDTVRNLSYTIEEDDVNEKYASTITEYVTSRRDEFIIGKKDINSDSDWKAYLSEFDGLHLDEIVKIKQDAYDRNQK
jgi:putative aldouronate transport system substrate-binding protein